jgi:hypothetical protein
MAATWARSSLEQTLRVGHQNMQRMFLGIVVLLAVTGLGLAALVALDKLIGR